MKSTLASSGETAGRIPAAQICVEQVAPATFELLYQLKDNRPKTDGRASTQSAVPTEVFGPHQVLPERNSADYPH